MMQMVFVQEGLEVPMRLSKADLNYLKTVYNIIYSKKKNKFFKNNHEIDESEVMTILEADEYGEDDTFEKFTNRGRGHGYY